MPSKWGWVAIVVLSIVLCAVLIGAGWHCGRRAFRVEAIKAGHARHVITDEYGHTDFQWLEKGDK